MQSNMVHLNKKSLESLPDDSILNTFNYLDYKDCINIELVSSKFKEISRDQKLWEFHLKIHYPDYLKYIQSTNQNIDSRKKFEILATYECSKQMPSWNGSHAAKIFCRNNQILSRDEVSKELKKRNFVYKFSELNELFETCSEYELPHNFRFIYWSRYVENRQDLLDYFYLCLVNADPRSQRFIHYLTWAVFLNQATMVDSFIQDAKTDLNNPTLIGQTPLYIAAYAGHCNVVAKLLNAKADVNQRVINHTPLYVAASMGHANIVALLIERKANVNSDAKEIVPTPLCDAASHGYVKTMSHLLEAKADANWRNDAFFTPLCLSASNDQLSAVKLLLEHKADPDLVSPGGKPFNASHVEELKRAILIARIEKHIDTLIKKIPKVKSLFSEKAIAEIKNETEAANKLKEICTNGWHVDDEEASRKYNKYWKNGLSRLYKDACNLKVVGISRASSCTIM